MSKTMRVTKHNKPVVSCDAKHNRPVVCDSPIMTLCARCEHRARAYETGHGPRCECTDLAHSYSSCYMYQPTAILIMARCPTELQIHGRKRPMAGPWMFSARLVAAGIAATTLHMRVASDNESIVLFRKLLRDSLTEREQSRGKAKKRAK